MDDLDFDFIDSPEARVMAETEEPQADVCDPQIGYHVVRPGEEDCQCGERKRMNSPQEESSEPKNILGCARCGNEHLVRFKPFRVPMAAGEITFTHWGMCPTTREPILMRFAPDQPHAMLNNIGHVPREEPDGEARTDS